MEDEPVRKVYRRKVNLIPSNLQFDKEAKANPKSCKALKDPKSPIIRTMGLLSIPDVLDDAPRDSIEQCAN